MPFDLCRKSGGPITFDSRSGAGFFNAGSFRLVDVSSDLLVVEWWTKLIPFYI